ncbi:MAG: CbtA family protein [Gammaproteobacteria bacterium]
MAFFRRLVFAAALAGAGAGLLLTFLHQQFTVPLIQQAEIFEALSAAGAHGEGWHPHSARERTLATATTDVLAGIAFALLLVAIWQWRGERPDWPVGIAWGLGGFLATTVAPSLGLPAELPGSLAAELPARQAWWVATAVLTATGLGAALLAQAPAWRILGVLAMAVPHLVGAPVPPAGQSPVPAEMLRAFQLAVYVCNFHFWVLLGLLASLAWRAQTR